MTFIRCGNPMFTTTVENLKKHGFHVLLAETEEEAATILREELENFIGEYHANHGNQASLANLAGHATHSSPHTASVPKPIISYGDSLSLFKICESDPAGNLLDQLRIHPDITFLDGFRKEDPRPEKLRIRREAILSDFYMTGVNAISSQGALYWVDMVGNRVASVSIGAARALIVAGKNKIVPTNADLDPRVRNIAGLENIARHPGFRTPCAKTGVCMDCNSPDRICNVRLTMERCYPAGRITLLLINQDLGL